MILYLAWHAVMGRGQQFVSKMFAKVWPGRGASTQGV